MMYNENLHEEEQHLIQQIAEQTERGKIDWELTEYPVFSVLVLSAPVSSVPVRTVSVL